MILKNGKLSYAEELGDMLVHLSEEGKAIVYGDSQSQQNCTVNGGKPNQKEITIT
ncbi:MAG: hypothetical protein QW667_07465 [Candidatus Bathyarchaeia archaeon]